MNKYRGNIKGLNIYFDVGLLFNIAGVNGKVGKEITKDLTTLLNNPDKIKTLGKAARETVKQKGHWDETVRKIKRLLEKV